LFPLQCAQGVAMPDAEVIVIGSGPNGLAAAIAMAQAGYTVTVLEAEHTIGGGARSGELTLPGFVHDLGSAVHPFAAASPFFRTLPLQQHGLEWVHPQVPVAHPLDGGIAVLLESSLERTTALLDEDGAAYAALIGPVLHDWPQLESNVLGRPHLPRHPLALARFAAQALRSAEGVGRRFRDERARALLAGLAAHSTLRLEEPVSAGIALALAAAGHLVGWPFPRGGAQRISDALASYLRSLGGKIVTGRRVHSLDELPPARAILCDITPRQLLAIAGDRLPPRFVRNLERYRYGPGAFKVDWALDAPIPWKAHECSLAGTVHLGGTFAEIAHSERAVWTGGVSERPFVLLSQPTVFDFTRAPAGKHTAWAYCHVPFASTIDMLDRIESQVERFAPGFRERILARAVMPPAALERVNANLIGGHINGGITDLWQIFMRPTLNYWDTPVDGLYLCSSSTPPGPGVHGMCGYLAAQLALRRM
jgi:phytoene dehydrogenase-like protein